MKYIFVSLFLLSLNSFSQVSHSTIGGGTTVLIVITKDTIWMAGDSKMNFSFTNKKWVSTVSKIGNYKNIFFGFSGKAIILLDKKGDTIFNAFRVMFEGLKKYNDLEKAAKYFTETSKKILDKFFKTPDAIEDKAAWIANGDVLFEMDIISFAKGLPVYHFYIYGVNKDSFNLRFRELPTAHGQDFIHCAGFCTLIKPYFSDAFFIGKGYPQGLTELIEKEIAANPDSVGKPINISVLYDKGHKWLTKPFKVYSSDF